MSALLRSGAAIRFGQINMRTQNKDIAPGGKSVSATKLKTWLAKAITRHPDPEGGASWVDYYRYFTVEASDEETAYEQALIDHCPDEDEDCQWGEMVVENDAPPLRACYLGQDSAPVDVGCGFAILWVKPVPADEYAILDKWLHV